MRLRLHRQDQDRDPDPMLREPDRLIFPRQALDSARSLSPDRAAAARARRGSEIVTSIEAELDHMQCQLTGLADDVENFKFPQGSDEPPFRAA